MSSARFKNFSSILGLLALLAAVVYPPRDFLVEGGTPMKTSSEVTSATDFGDEHFRYEDALACGSCETHHCHAPHLNGIPSKRTAVRTPASKYLVYLDTAVFQPASAFLEHDPRPPRT